MRLIMIVTLLICLSAGARADDADARHRVMTAVIDHLEQDYIDPDLGRKAARALRLALAGVCRDPVLQQLDVVRVEPAPDARRLRVIVSPPAAATVTVDLQGAYTVTTIRVQNSSFGGTRHVDVQVSGDGEEFRTVGTAAFENYAATTHDVTGLREKGVTHG